MSFNNPLFFLFSIQPCFFLRYFGFISILLVMCVRYSRQIWTYQRIANTGQCAWCITLFATLPTNTSSAALIPVVPINITSILFFLAYSIIAFSTVSDSSAATARWGFHLSRTAANYVYIPQRELTVYMVRFRWCSLIVNIDMKA